MILMTLFLSVRENIKVRNQTMNNNSMRLASAISIFNVKNNKFIAYQTMKEFIVLLSLLLLLAGIIWNYNVGVYGGTNLIVTSIILMIVSMIFHDDTRTQKPI